MIETEYGITRAAELIGTSVQRVRALIANGTLAAQQRPHGDRLLHYVSGESLAAYVGTRQNGRTVRRDSAGRVIGVARPVGTREVYTSGEVARLCNVCTRTVTQWHQSGALPGYVMPNTRARRFRHADLVAFMKQHGLPLGNLVDVASVVLYGLPSHLSAAVAAALPGYRVTVPRDAVDAVFAVQEERPATVVLDLSLGRGECLSMVQSLRRRVAAPVFVGLAGEDERDEAGLLAGGFWFVLRHPVAAAELAALVRESNP